MITAKVQSVIKWVGSLSAWCTVFLVLVVCTDTILRYFFSTTRTWVVELEWHLYSLVFLLGFAFTLKEDKHVRVDVFYSRFSERSRSLLNALGHLLFLIPWSCIIILTSYRFVWTSFMIGEGSPNPAGLPYRFVIKSMIMLGFILLIVQAMILMVTEIRSLLMRKSDHGA